MIGRYNYVFTNERWKRSLFRHNNFWHHGISVYFQNFILRLSLFTLTTLVMNIEVKNNDNLGRRKFRGKRNVLKELSLDQHLILKEYNTYGGSCVRNRLVLHCSSLSCTENNRSFQYVKCTTQKKLRFLWIDSKKKILFSLGI